MIQYIVIYFIIINTVAFFLYGEDKRKARKQQWRISEKTLLLTAIIGGSIGAWMGMHVFHHKTKHAKFYIGVPIIFIIQVLLLFYIFLKYFQ